MPKGKTSDRSTGDSAGSPPPTLVKTFRGHRDGVTSVAFNPAPPSLGRTRRQGHLQLASSSLDGTLTLWNYSPASGDVGRCRSGHGSSNDEVRAYRFIGHTGPVHHVTYSPSGHLLASCSSDKTVRLWLPNATGDSVILRGHNGPVRCVDFSRASHGDLKSPSSRGGGGSESLLLTCSDDKTVKVWTLPHKSFRCSLTGHTNWVRTCKFSPDSPNIAASGGDDRLVKLWDVEHGENLINYNYGLSCASSNLAGAAPVGSVRDLAFHPTGTALAASGTDGCVRLYDLRSDEMIQHYAVNGGAQGSSVDGVLIHPSGNYMLGGSVSKAGCLVSIWDLRSSRLLNTVSHDNGRSKSLQDASCCIGCSPDGLHFASGTSKKAVMLWRLGNGCDTKSQIGGDEDKVGTIRQTLPRERPSTAPTGVIPTTQHHPLPSKPRGKRTPCCTNNCDADMGAGCKQTVRELEFVIEDIAGEDVKDVSPPTRNEAQKDTAPAALSTFNSQSSWHSGDRSTLLLCDKENLPEVLAGTLDHIVGQITILAQTIQMMDQRLSLQEDVLKQLLANKEKYTREEDTAERTTNEKGSEEQVPVEHLVP